jgi:hypothetical protein
MCFANAVLQLLVHSPPFWNLSRVLGDLKGRHGGGSETGGGVTPLVDATVRSRVRSFMDFTLEVEPPPTKQSLQRSARERQGDAEEGTNTVDSFESTYIYDAMKEKRKLKNCLYVAVVGMRPSITDLYWTIV